MRMSERDPVAVLEDELRDLDVLGERDLHVARLALHQAREVPARFDRFGFVRGLRILLEAAPQEFVAEHLRSLSTPQPGARDGGLAALVLLGAPPRVRQRPRAEPADLVVSDLV